eukprot:scaffold722_cov230-Pinguiococcus_pyrenoidosus.AAC.2
MEIFPQFSETAAKPCQLARLRQLERRIPVFHLELERTGKLWKFPKPSLVRAQKTNIARSYCRTRLSQRHPTKRSAYTRDAAQKRGSAVTKILSIFFRSGFNWSARATSATTTDIRVT